MKTGDKVIAVVDGIDVTKGKTYKITEVNGLLIRIIDDRGDVQWVESKNYELVAELKQKTEKNDKVNHPSHYQTAGGIEVIEYISSLLGDNVKAYYLGNVIKYVSRFDKKNGVEDLKKARFYLNKMIEMGE